MATRSEMAKEFKKGQHLKPPETNLERAETARPNTFLGKIVKVLFDDCRNLMRDNPDAKSNTGVVLAEMFLWKEIEKYAKARYEVLKRSAKADKIIDVPEEEDDALAPGHHILGESRHFVVTAIVTEKVKRFSADVFAQGLFESHKIPVIITKEKIEKAKVPTKSQVKIAIVERT